MQRTSKTQQMMDGFMSRHNEGHTIPEIADIFGVSVETVYHNLEEIARNNNVSRESLLAQPKIIVKNVIRSDEVDLNELVANFSRLEREFADVIGKIEQLTRE